MSPAASNIEILNDPGTDDRFGCSLARFEPVSLDAIETIAVANRLDTKFTFGMPKVPDILEALEQSYYVLTVEGVCAQRYQTQYFDTSSLNLYQRHHSGIYPRHKVRCRRYVDSGISFLEVKTKRNNGRTLKHRRPALWNDGELMPPVGNFVHEAAPGLPADLLPAVRVDFTRLTLVNKDWTERVTIDVDLTFSHRDLTRAFPGLVIAEVKRDRSATRSLFLRKLGDRHVREGSISKYCLGIMSLYPHAKRNRFKERLHEINNLAA